MRFQRSTGILMHISSLASYGGIGDLGPEAYRLFGGFGVDLNEFGLLELILGRGYEDAEGFVAALFEGLLAGLV